MVKIIILKLLKSKKPAYNPTYYQSIDNRPSHSLKLPSFTFLQHNMCNDLEKRFGIEILGMLSNIISFPHLIRCTIFEIIFFEYFLETRKAIFRIMINSRVYPSSNSLYHIYLHIPLYKV